jgi:hypothetical protein
LLALWHFQKTLPLERKIPEPFSSTWLQLVASEKLEKNSISKFSKKNIAPVGEDLSVGKKILVPMTGAVDILSSHTDIDNGNRIDLMNCKEVNIQNEIEMKPKDDNEKIEIPKSESYKQVYKKKKPDVSEKVLDKATSDWLCDNCDAQNFAKLLSGNSRVKCFKCSTTRGASCVLVLSVAQVDAVNLANSLNEKRTPQAITSLKNTVNIMSQAELDRKNLEEYLLQKQKNFIEELKKANKYTQVSIHPKIIEMIESTLGISELDYGFDKIDIQSTQLDVNENINKKDLKMNENLKISSEKKIGEENEILILSENSRIIDLIMLYGWERVDCEEALLYAYKVEESNGGFPEVAGVDTSTWDLVPSDPLALSSLGVKSLFILWSATCALGDIYGYICIYLCTYVNRRIIQAYISK